MRNIQAAALDAMQSPIREVMRRIPYALDRCAPDLKRCFVSEFDHSWLEFVDSDRWICSVNVSAKRIFLSSKTMEVLWSASFAWIQVYLACASRLQQAVSVSDCIEFSGDPTLASATELLSWGLDSLQNESGTPWPSHLPMPKASSTKGSAEDLADELSVYAIGFVLYHEFAHICLKHRGGSTVSAENEADRTAADWMLSQGDCRGNGRLKRLLGIIVALGVLIAATVDTEDHGRGTHPPPYERLPRVLDLHVRDSNHPVWLFAAVVLKLHLDNSPLTRDVVDAPFTTIREAVDLYLARIAAWSAGSSIETPLA